MSREIVVLISGSGTNLQALIDAVNNKSLNARIKLVISNRSKAFGLSRAQKAEIPTTTHILKPYKDAQSQDESGIRRAREHYDSDLADVIVSAKPELVVCAGWMHILSPIFLDKLRDAHVGIINLHPALPGQFDGANAIERAWEAGQKGEIIKSGLMVHWLIKEVDMGEPILTQEIEIIKGESLESFEERMHSIEHEIIVKGTEKALDILGLNNH